MGTPRFSYGGTDFGQLVKVALWSGASAFAIAITQQLQVVDWASVLGDKAPFAVMGVNVLIFAVTQFFSNTEK